MAATVALQCGLLFFAGLIHTELSRMPPKPMKTTLRLALSESPSLSDPREAVSETEPRPEPKPEPRPEPKPEPRPEPKPEPRPEPKPEPRPEPKPEPRPEPKPEPRPEPKPEPRPEPKPEPRPEPKPEPRPEPKPEPRPEPKPEPRPEPKPEPRPEPLTEPRPEVPAPPAPVAAAAVSPEPAVPPAPAPTLPAPAPPAAPDDVEDFDRLMADLAALIDQYKSFPRAALRARLQGAVAVRVRIDSEGRLMKYEMMESSGHRILDQATLKLFERLAGRRISPVHPRRGLDIVVPVRYVHP
jgi:periplasmic protein TonB